MTDEKEHAKAKSASDIPAGADPKPAGQSPVQQSPVPVPAASSEAEVAAFINKMKTLAPSVGTGHGRLVFAMDATMSRQPAWDMAGFDPDPNKVESGSTRAAPARRPPQDTGACA